MPYKITIERIESVTSKQRGEWTVIDRVPWTDEELNEKISSAYGEHSRASLLGKEPLRDIFGYTPDRDTTATVATKILEQTVETIHLPEVIKAINNL